jgi:hypothetical protein
LDNERTGPDTSLPQNKADLIARIQHERAALERVISTLNDAQMIMPGPEGWSVKDHLAHIVAWEQILVHAHLGGQSFAEAAQMDEATAAATAHMTAETGLNEWLYQRDKSRPLAEVLTDFQQSHQQVLAALDKLEWAELLQPRAPHTPDAAPRLAYIRGDTYEHYQEHRRIIDAMMEQAR